METNRGLNAISLCRLCGVCGDHQFDVFGGKAGSGQSNRNTLGKKILRCVEVRVERSDKSTKICGSCFCKVYEYNRFREICAATDATMGRSNPLRNVTDADSSSGMIEVQESGDVAAQSSSGIVSQNRTSSSDPSIECISLIDDDSCAECDETSAEPQIAGNNRVVANEASTSKQGNLDGNPENVEPDNRKMRGPESPSAVLSAAVHCDEGDELTSDSDDETESIAFNVSGQNSNKKHQQTETQRLRVLNGSKADVDGESSSAHTSSVALRSEKVSAKKKNVAKKRALQSVPVFSVKCRRPGCGRNCKESFESRHAMMLHVKTYHAKGVKKTFECHLCKKTSTSHANLQSHMNSLHAPNIRFMCPIRACAKIFTQKGSLKQHTDAVHTKKLAFKCSKCSMKFNRKQHLTRHMANKHGQGITFTCYLCKSSLGFKQNLKMHMDSLHTYQPRFKCPFPMCPKSFTQKGNLIVHTNAMHTKRNEFKCTECGRVFYQKGNLIRHLANKH